MDRLFLLTARKYADSGGRCEASSGAVGERGAAGGYQDPHVREHRSAIVTVDQVQLSTRWLTGIVTSGDLLDLDDVRAQIC